MHLCTHASMPCKHAQTFCVVNSFTSRPSPSLEAFFIPPLSFLLSPLFLLALYRFTYVILLFSIFFFSSFALSSLTFAVQLAVIGSVIA